MYPITLATLDDGARGATWAPDDTIIFATYNPATGLQRVSATGGHRSHVSPQRLCGTVTTLTAEAPRPVSLGAVTVIV